VLGNKGQQGASADAGGDQGRNENVSATAVEHLGKVREVSVVDALIRILDSGEIWTAYPAADALGRIGNKKAIPICWRRLQKSAQGADPESARRLAEPSTLENILPMFRDPSKNIQEQALKTVERFYHNGVDADFIISEMKRVIGGPVMDFLISHAWSGKREVRISAISSSG